MQLSRLRAAVSMRSTVRNAEDLLGGRSLTTLQVRGEPVSSWAIVNMLGHAERKLLAAHAEASTCPATWPGVASVLAGHLLYLAGGVDPDPGKRDDLRRLQRAALVPLELDLLAGTLAEPDSPPALRELVVDRLEEHRISR